MCLCMSVPVTLFLVRTRVKLNEQKLFQRKYVVDGRVVWGSPQSSTVTRDDPYPVSMLRHMRASVGRTAGAWRRTKRHRQRPACPVFS